MSAYTLELTDDDFDAIGFAGGRYRWSSALQTMNVGTNELAEHEAWQLASACEEDCTGGHSMFPLLDPRSELYAKLTALLDSIV